MRTDMHPPHPAGEQEGPHRRSPRRRSARWSPRRRESPTAQWPAALSANARRIIELFNLSPADFGAPLRAVIPPGVVSPAPGRILLITGPSGAGKSVLLRRLCAAASRRVAVINVGALALAPAACVDQFGRDLPAGLDLLNRVGLGEAYTYLRRPDELSDGQRWRLRLAVSIHRAMALHGRKHASRPPIDAIVLAADEFGAVLDGVSAAVVARSLRRIIDRLHRVGLPLAAMLAT